eukprot:GHVL01005898.1.p1 GENE.GHVL01005898.1~~GHVL01005898.1.p1  ORF type:complete len:132 (-),score=26.28 GHVL01005898.1:133-528(-)
MGARAALQFYPECSDQLKMILDAATRSGFGGGLVVDFPESTRAKKFFLSIYVGGTPMEMPKALGVGSEKEEADEISYSNRRVERHKRKRKNDKIVKKSRDWIVQKKQKLRDQGKTTRPDTKYTGRRRPKIV